MKPFGKYLLHERIATGGMAEVFKGSLLNESSGFERLVAIKVILPQLGEDRDFVSMFIDEAKIAVQLSHSNIAQILDLGREGDAYFIAMEYVHGRDLRAILERERKRRSAVPVAVACHVAMKIAAALHHAHNATGRDGRPLGVIHRDVSPQNVLVSFDGEVKVCDFGLAKAAGRATQTNAGVVKGKLAYLSPQQAHGEDIDHRSDLYSLGLVLFELLTGRRMFDRGNDIDTVLAVQRNETVRLREAAPSMPAHLEAIIARALSRDPERRYQTGMDFHDDLEMFIYEHGALVTRKDVAGYVRALFEESTAPSTVTAVIEEPPRHDTIPVAAPPDSEPPPDSDPATLVRVPPDEDRTAESQPPPMPSSANPFEDDLMTVPETTAERHDTWITQLSPGMPDDDGSVLDDADLDPDTDQAGESTQVAHPEHIDDLARKSRDES